MRFRFLNSIGRALGILAFVALAGAAGAATSDTVFFEGFTSDTIDAVTWPVVEWAEISDAADNEPSPPWSLLLNGEKFPGPDLVASREIDLTDAAGAMFVYHYQRKVSYGDGDDLIVEYTTDSLQWAPLDRVTDGEAMEGFLPRSIPLPDEATTDTFRVRFRREGYLYYDLISGTIRILYGDYHVDDVAITTSPFVLDVSPTSGTTIASYRAAVDVTFSDDMLGVEAGDMVLGGAAASAGAYVADPAEYRGARTWRFRLRDLTTGALDLALAPDPGDIVNGWGRELDPSPTRFSYDVAIQELPLPFADDFASPTIRPDKWTTWTAGVADLPSSAPSPPYAVRLGGPTTTTLPGKGDRLESSVFDLTGLERIELHYSYASSDTLGQGDDLAAEGWSDADEWVEMARHLGADGDVTSFTFHDVRLTSDLLHEGFQFRFRREGHVDPTSGTIHFGDWFVDDVTLAHEPIGTPTVVAVEVVTTRQIQVTFSQEMGAGVLDPANYEFFDGGQGTFAPHPDAVEFVREGVYLLTWNAGEMHIGDDIWIAVSHDVENEGGNNLGRPDRAPDYGGGLGVRPVSAVTNPSGEWDRWEIPLEWTAIDPGAPDGVSLVEVFWSKDGGTTHSLGAFDAATTGVVFDALSSGAGGRYRFHSLATDRAGNGETWTGADAVIDVTARPPIEGVEHWLIR